MTLRVDEMRTRRVTLDAEEPAASFPTLRELQERGDVEFTSPVTVRITASAEPDDIRVEGEAGVTASFTCSRCLVPLQQQVSSSFVIFYRKGKKTEPEEDEVELSEVDLVSATYDGDEIDLVPEIADQVAMELPLKPLCREECKGLCSFCGADLNEGECGCPRSGGFAFGALKDFKVKK